MEKRMTPTTDKTTAESFVSIEEDTKAMIEKFGWYVQSVFKDEASPAYAYTVGLTETYKHPEIIVFGLPANRAHAFLHHAIDEIEQSGRLEPLKRNSMFAVGLDVMLLDRVTQREKYMLAAVERYGANGFSAMQLVWPDTENNFPWEFDFDERFASDQPILGTPPPLFEGKRGETL
jgi:hypothetical protein